MKKRVWGLLWLLAGLATLALLAATVGLGAQAWARSEESPTVFLVGRSKMVVLFDQPDQKSGVAAMMERGAAVRPIALALTDDQLWYQIESEAGSGWVQVDQLSLTPP